MQPTSLLDGSRRFNALNDGLTEYRQYWQLQAFSYLELPWREQEPELCAWLDGLSQEQVQAYAKNKPLLIKALSHFLPNIEHLAALGLFSALRTATVAGRDITIPSRFSSHIKGRKWLQIQKFVAASNNSDKTLEWCAGKGHLGRLLAYKQQQPVTSVEWLPELCEHGQQLAESNHLPVSYLQADVLSGDADHLLCAHGSAVALHACGELHLHLIRQGAQAKINQLVIAPCCYHLIPQSRYQPLSTLAKQSQLCLTHQDLRFPLQETVVAGARIQRLRQVELSWRLGFDCLQRKVTGVEQYMPVPSIAKKRLSGSFREFCQWAAFEKSLSLPSELDYGYYLQLGCDRLDLLAKIELVQQPFKAAVEAWLILDRALFLQEQGYEVELGTFCERALTPRNLMIRACLRNK